MSATTLAVGRVGARERVFLPVALPLPALAAYAVLVAVGIALRPLIPVDETRYATVAWEMWSHGEWLVPQLNGATYAHKPPLLFWLIHLGWAVFDVNDWWLRVLGPALTLLDTALLALLTSRLWPAHASLRRLVPTVFLGGWFVALYSTGLMFDLLLLAWVLGAWLALWRAAAGGGWRAFAVVAACLGGGLLAKGPVVFLYVLPLALTVRWWSPRAGARFGGGWFGGVFLAALASLLVPLAWVAAVAANGEHAYLRELLFDQTAQRVTGQIGHGRPWYWYLERLPLLALPWLFWPPVWRAWSRWRGALVEPGVRFASLGIVIPLVLFSCVGGKQLHYLVPLAALAAMLTARLLSDVPAPRGWRDQWLPALVMSPFALGALLYAVAHGRSEAAPWIAGWSPPWVVAALVPMLLVLSQRRRGTFPATVGMACASLAFAAVLLANALAVTGPRYDLRGAAQYVATQQRAGRPVSILAGAYQGEFGFLGRLQMPVQRLRASDVADWVARHPDGLLIARAKRLQLPDAVHPEYVQAYKTDVLLMVDAGALATPGVRIND